MNVRDATRADLERIVAIYNETIPGRMVTADLETVTVEARLPWFARHDPRHHPLWVAEQDGAIVGWLSFEEFYGRPAYAGTAEVSVYVAREAHRQGIGMHMLQRAIARAPHFGINTLLGFIFAHNAPSVELFKRAGFERWAHLPRVANLDGVERSLDIFGRRVAE